MDLPFSQALSLHIDRPARRRVTGAFQEAMAEVTQRTASSFGTAIIGLHDGKHSSYLFFAGQAHRRDADGHFIPPDNPADQLYDAQGKPLPDAPKRWVSGTLIDAAGRRADDHAFFALPPAPFAAVQQHVAAMAAAPPAYHMFHANCVQFAKAALVIAGIALPTNSLPPSVARLRRPEDMSQALLHAPARPGVMVMTASPLLLR